MVFCTSLVVMALFICLYVGASCLACLANLANPALFYIALHLPLRHLPLRCLARIDVHRASHCITMHCLSFVLALRLPLPCLGFACGSHLYSYPSMHVSLWVCLCDWVVSILDCHSDTHSHSHIHRHRHSNVYIQRHSLKQPTITKVHSNMEIIIFFGYRVMHNTSCMALLTCL